MSASDKGNESTSVDPRVAASGPSLPPAVPDHTLIRIIGQGSYGEVWLAQNALGTLRAVKIVHRSKFSDARPFHRELDGLKKFELISRSGEGLVHILHVGQNEEGKYFYYVMELADNAADDETDYVPGTLSTLLKAKGRLPFPRCLKIASALAKALDELHSRGLVHRDLKPSNIIFVNGQPKIADIGLVTDMNSAATLVGTLGFIAPEGPGTRAADIFSLGKLFYEMSTGKDREHFPDPPTRLDQFTDHEGFLEWNELLLIACASEPSRRYKSARAMLIEIHILEHGGSVRRLHRRRYYLAGLGRVALLVLLGCLWPGLQLLFKSDERKDSTTAEVRPSDPLERFTPSTEEALSRAETSFLEDKFGAGLAQLASISRLQPANHIAASRLLSALVYRSYGVLATPVLAHADDAYASVLNQQGTLILTGCDDGTGRLWDVTTGAALTPVLTEESIELGKYSKTDRSLRVRPAPLLLFSPNQPLFATSFSSSFQIWQTNGTSVTKLIPQSSPFQAMQFSPDGQHLFGISAQGISEKWDLPQGSLSLPGLQLWEGFDHAQFSPDGRTAAGAWKNNVLLFELPSGRLKAQLPHLGRDIRIHFSPNGQTILTGSEGQSPRLWTSDSGRLLHDLKEAGSFRSGGFSPDGALVAAGLPDGTFQVWQTESGRVLSGRRHGGHDHEVTALNFSADSKFILSGSADGTARLWDTRSGEPLTESLQHQQHVTSVSFSTGHRIVTGSRDRSARIWRIHAQFAARLLPHDMHVLDANYSPDGASVLTASDDASARLWDAKRGLLSRVLKHESAVERAVFSPDGNRILTVASNAACMWDRGTGLLLNTIHHRHAIDYATYSRDGKKILTSSSAASEARVWEGGFLKPLAGPLAHDGGIECGDFSPDGHFLVTCGGRSAWLWDLSQSSSSPAILAHSHHVLVVRFSMDGSKIITASDDHDVRIWDLSTHKPLGEPLRHEAGVNSLSLSRDGKLLATVCNDGTARVWELETRLPLTRPLKHKRRANSAEFSPDGRLLVTAAGDNHVRVWDLQTGSLLLEPLNCRGWVYSAHFSPDGKNVLAASDFHAGLIWELPLPAVSEPVPGWLPDLAECIGGRRLDVQGVLQPADAGTFFEIKREVLRSTATDTYTRWAKICLAEF